MVFLEEGKRAGCGIVGLLALDFVVGAGREAEPREGSGEMRIGYVVMGMAVLLLAGCSCLCTGVEESEEEIPLSQVPLKVRQAAEGAVEGIVLSEAEVEVEDGQKVYELEGVAKGKEYEIEVTAEGKVLEDEEEDDDDEDDDDDD